MLRSLLFGGVILLALSSVAMADLIDPRMIIDAGDPDPLPISTGINSVVPNGVDATQTFDFINDLGQIIVGFLFHTTVAPDFDGVFSCESGYFLNCTAEYNPTNGDLLYSFFGVLPPDGDEDAFIDDQAGEHQGIPLHGLFHITIEGFETPGLYDSEHPPTAFAGTILLTPEPSALFILLASFALIAGCVEFRRRRRQPAAISAGALP